MCLPSDGRVPPMHLWSLINLVIFVTMLQNQQRPWWKLVLSRLTVAGLFISGTLLYCLSTLHYTFSPTECSLSLLLKAAFS
ncbi:unnamed protein product [Pleuronectes platessa]|uniref:Uncharacterized protein n=1 Tax=Pleuronectes platessa TaxID=8262 RepID=A0A9N7V0U5_PLEPL|nr:unnamed protein product [Pleuronectes platessa]